ncbi:Hypothetical predicted protein [Pelobates cultripes]|uniref:Uncharacterized protein n=1 Tax=Pelobates cultripes TaxID=61616 RepID=A0AAD1RRX7_PELCU|nr:Hypothetical predicted protein [Pelobates cultripes]
MPLSFPVETEEKEGPECPDRNGRETTILLEQMETGRSYSSSLQIGPYSAIKVGHMKQQLIPPTRLSSATPQPLHGTLCSVSTLNQDYELLEKGIGNR